MLVDFGCRLCFRSTRSQPWGGLTGKQPWKSPHAGHRSTAAPVLSSTPPPFWTTPPIIQDLHALQRLATATRSSKRLHDQASAVVDRWFNRVRQFSAEYLAKIRAPSKLEHCEIGKYIHYRNYWDGPIHAYLQRKQADETALRPLVAFLCTTLVVALHERRRKCVAF